VWGGGEVVDRGDGDGVVTGRKAGIALRSDLTA
jgi:hypothetical protein